MRPGCLRIFPGAGRSSESSSARPRSTVDSEIPVASPPPRALHSQRSAPPLPPTTAAYARPATPAHQQPIPLTNRALIDHNPQFYTTHQTPSQTKSRALSFKVAPGVRYRTSGSRGRSVVVGTSLEPADDGVLSLTSSRVVFQGDRKTVESRLDRLTSVESTTTVYESASRTAKPRRSIA